MDVLQEQIASCQRTLETSTEWKVQVQELVDLHAVLEELDDAAELESMAVVVDSLVPLTDRINALIPSIRSEVVKKTCAVIAGFATICGAAFVPFADQVLFSILNTAKIHTQVFWQAGEDCMAIISSRSRYSLEKLLDYFDDVRADEVRLLIEKQLPIIMQNWSKEELDPYYDRLKSHLQKALNDKNDQVRVKARQAFCNFCNIWEEHLDDLVHLPSLRLRTAISQEYPSARITQVLVNKFGAPGSGSKRTPLRLSRASPASTPPPSQPSSTYEQISFEAPLAPPVFSTPTRRIAAVAAEPGPVDPPLPKQPEVVAPFKIHSHETSAVAAKPAPTESPAQQETEAVTPVDPPAHNAPKELTSEAATKPSLGYSILDSLLSFLTGVSILVLLYTVVGAIYTAVALQRSGGIMDELRQLDASISHTFSELKAKEAAMDRVMSELLESMDAQRIEAHGALQTLRQSSAKWNKSMRDDMEAFREEFLAQLRPLD
ncbi:unnamed protein product [Aphanomyces euteiches]|uniref:CLASP N-terminal domain-containing protein n=1 Tax=Aphanomyces euteiches TaxID=100861 RepID=A0A6G0X445_9STRA|nr:hypothetical protein Ae201684_008652 [Aphanomyces euteiches]KAH9133750.1 hypothetical protein AeRB84_020235 [Aphanomyces euteiches]